MTHHISFEGPLFIVGAGRSGTKLLRTFLNNHSSVSFPTIESKFIPDFKSYVNTNSDGDLNIEAYFSFFKSTTFYHRMSRRKPLDEELIKRNISSNDASAFVESILKYYSLKFDRFDNFHYIWGDKSPLYINHVDLLYQLFPSTRIVHIIRDPRDVALSYHKTWGKSLYGTAEKWRNIMERSEQIITNTYLEVHYEDLIQHPEKVLTKICDFLEISFEKEMIRLTSSVEKSTSRSNTDKILKNNFGKFKNKLNARQIKKIEAITKKYLISKGYQLENKNVKYHPLGTINKSILRVKDFLSFLSHLYLQENDLKGVMINIKYQLKKHLF